MFPLQRGRMLVNMAKRKAETPTQPSKRARLTELQDISHGSRILATHPDIRVDFVSDPEIDVSSTPVGDIVELGSMNTGNYTFNLIMVKISKLSRQTMLTMKSTSMLNYRLR